MAVKDRQLINRIKFLQVKEVHKKERKCIGFST